MLCNHMIVGEIPDKKNSFAVYVVDAIENIPNGLFVVLKGRIEQICSIAFEIGRSPFPNFDREIGLDIAKQLF